MSTASAVLSTRIALAGAAADVIAASGALSTQILLAASAADSTSAAGSLSAFVMLFATANNVTLAAGTLITQIAMASSAATATLAQASLSTAIQLVGTAQTGTSSAAVLDTVPAVPFGRVVVLALSQGEVQHGRSIYLENSACFVTARYFSSSGVGFVPKAVQYRVDDVESQINIVPWTAIAPQATNAVTITSAQNGMISLSRRRESHQVLFQITDGFGDVNFGRVTFDLIRAFEP